MAKVKRKNEKVFKIPNPNYNKFPHFKGWISADKIPDLKTHKNTNTSTNKHKLNHKYTHKP